MAGSWDSAVGRATGYRLADGRGGGRVPIRSIIFFLHVVQTGSGATQLGTGSSLLGGKAAGTYS
jgi:hypothetical protein